MDHEDTFLLVSDRCTSRSGGSVCRGELGQWPLFAENAATTAAQAAAARLGLTPVGLRVVGTVRRRIRKRVYEIIKANAGVILGHDEYGRVIVRWDDGITIHIPGNNFWAFMIPDTSTSVEAGLAAHKIRLRNEIDRVVDLVAEGGARGVNAEPVHRKLRGLEEQLDLVDSEIARLHTVST
jgi:hypothetical protein